MNEQSRICIPAELDMVCNEGMLAESQSMLEKCRLNIAKDGISILLIPLFLVFGSIAVYLAYYTFQDIILYPKNYSVALIVLCKALLFGILALATKQAISITGRGSPFPTNVHITQLGIKFAWRTKKAVASPVIAWKAIEHIEVERSCQTLNHQPLRGVRLIVRIRTVLLEDKRSGWTLLCKLSRLLTSWFPYPKVNGRIDFGALEIEFPLDALTLEADKYRLVSVIKERVSALALGEGFLRLSDGANAPTFTQLWLDDLNSFRRQHVLELEPGATLNDGRYRVVDTIATGGQAKIYRGVDVVSNREIAIKELILPTNAGAEVRNRSFANVRTEAMLLGRLNHPNIVKLLDNFVEDHRAYLILEHVKGKTLRALVQNGSALPCAEVCKIAISMCSFLEYLHNQSPPIIHRDLTPDNVLYSPEGDVKLLDFNVAKFLESSSTKTVVGKHNYMAPEQFRGQATIQSDLYSLGCTLHYLLTGEDPVALCCSHPSAKKPETPVALDEVVARLTDLNLEQRYQSAAQAKADLQTIV